MSAVFSPDGRYRYRLDRKISDKPGRAAWIMLNPSVAGEEVNDPTATRVINFTDDWGYGTATIGNLAALVSTDPKALKLHGAPIGPYNDEHLHEIVLGADIVIAAWGSSYPKGMAYRVAEIRRRFGDRLHHLGLTKNGDPRHPLYLPASTQPEPWRTNQ